MSLLSHLTTYVTSQTSNLAPITLPLPPLTPLSSLIQHLTSTPVHATYYPFLRFGVIHATRVALVWSVIARGRNSKNVGTLQDLLGFLTLAWGGGTLISLLLNDAPTWLISPTPWILYTSIYFLLLPTSLASYFTSTCPPYLLDILGSAIDGLTRGTTISALPALIGASGLKGGLYAQLLLSGIAVSGGGWIVQTLGMQKGSWELGVPNVLKEGGVWGTADVWSGALAGLAYSGLTKQHAESAWIGEALLSLMPEDRKVSGAGASKINGRKEMVDHETARAVCVLLVGAVLAARAIVTRSQANRSKKRVLSKDKKLSEKTPVKEKAKPKDRVEIEIVKSPMRSRTATPRKSPKPKAK